ncbi:hypothetical protein FLP10_00220 [Agromyces intestinalis]|uniref:Uncharacterized protein n=1 Tax=Agromyces intestinalis TaxID=2592652 RepID=A0A5C1YCD9_9MICO|nr:hypothetical protein [Agromyces intestinalis]QEO13015.1 hypothetical protein FLP10_00220 [Agromyces intestinalis]
MGDPRDEPTPRDENAATEHPDVGGEQVGALSDDDLIRKDVSESPGSEAEVAAKQRDPLPDSLDDDIDAGQIRAVPGTGGPDDAGDVDVDPDDLNLPGAR